MRARTGFVMFGLGRGVVTVLLMVSGAWLLTGTLRHAPHRTGAL